jgi:hypothetical protein
MSVIHGSLKGDIKSKPSTANKQRVKVQRLTSQEAQEFRERLGLPNSYLTVSEMAYWLWCYPLGGAS